MTREPVDDPGTGATKSRAFRSCDGFDKLISTRVLLVIGLYFIFFIHHHIFLGFLPYPLPNPYKMLRGPPTSSLLHSKRCWHLRPFSTSFSPFNATSSSKKDLEKNPAPSGNVNTTHPAAVTSTITAKDLISSRLDKLKGNTDGYPQSHLFQPAAAQGPLSPMRRSSTWIEALSARREQLKEGKVLDSYRFTNVTSETHPQILEKTRGDSFSYVILSFKDDPWLLDAYINSTGRLRIGQLFQDLDALAGVISYKHCAPAEPMLVTASVDRVFMLKRLDNLVTENVVLAGSVTWTGRSSMEVSIKAISTTEELPEKITENIIDENDVFLTCNMTFVARNPVTRKSYPVNKLLPITEKDWIDFRHSESYNAAKKLNASKMDLQKQPPTAFEAKLIHDLWCQEDKFEPSRKDSTVKSLTRPRSLINVSESKISSTMIMQPQYRNLHSYMIFGGYLLRQTFELAYACAAAFSHASPRFVCLDTTTFKNPVPVGSVLYMTATVVYTEHIHHTDLPTQHKDEYWDENKSNEYLSKPGTLIQITVNTNVRDLEHGTYTNTGLFAYSFFVSKEDVLKRNEAYMESNPDARRDNELNEKENGYLSVIPQTYGEMIDWLEGRRRAESSQTYAKRHFGAIITE